MLLTLKKYKVKNARHDLNFLQSIFTLTFISNYALRHFSSVALGSNKYIGSQLHSEEEGTSQQHAKRVILHFNLLPNSALNVSFHISPSLIRYLKVTWQACCIFSECLKLLLKTDPNASWKLRLENPVGEIPTPATVDASSVRLREWRLLVAALFFADWRPKTQFQKVRLQCHTQQQVRRDLVAGANVLNSCAASLWHATNHKNRSQDTGALPAVFYLFSRWRRH